MSYSFSCGDIIRLQEVNYTDHPKYHLVLSIRENLFFVINTNINNTVALNPEFLNSQVQLEPKEGKEFPEHTCYIACHEIADDIYSADIEREFQNNNAKNYGKIDLGTIKSVINVLYNHCKTLSPVEKKEIIKNLEELKGELEK